MWRFPKEGAAPKWMVYIRKSMKILLKWMIWGYSHLRKHIEPSSVTGFLNPLFTGGLILLACWCSPSIPGFQAFRTFLGGYRLNIGCIETTFEYLASTTDKKSVSHVVETRINHPQITKNSWYKPFPHGWFIIEDYFWTNPMVFGMYFPLTSVRLAGLPWFLLEEYAVGFLSHFDL